MQEENLLIEEDEVITSQEPRETKVLTFYNHEYTIIKGRDRGGKFPQPCFRNLYNWALKSVKKLR